MSKRNIMCNHCKKSIHWYSLEMEEVDYYKIGDNTYCGECIKEITKYYVEESRL